MGSAREDQPGDAWVGCAWEGDGRGMEALGGCGTGRPGGSGRLPAGCLVHGGGPSCQRTLLRLRGEGVLPPRHAPWSVPAGEGGTRGLLEAGTLSFCLPPFSDCLSQISCHGRCHAAQSV